MPGLVTIDSPDDPRLEAYRDIRERDLTGRGGRFIAEGRVVIEKLLATRPGCVESLLVAAHRADAAADLIQAMPDGSSVYAASQEAMDQVVGFPIHRGLLAVGLRPDTGFQVKLQALESTATPLVVVLIGISNHDNMGGILRNAAAFGADLVVLDETCCDPFYRKAIRVSVGAALTLEIAVAGPGSAIVAELTAAGYEVLALTPAGETRLAEVSRPRRTAVVFGAEGPGLPDEIIAAARGVRIEMSGGFDSLNVATTSGIVLHQLVS